ncbi:MAG: hydantoinase B/oxoprolinase family protein [Chloroflexi bacterium]|nr:hydantoinase B/oxoprolinase family protein [Chloroflexota bacterium]
MSAHEYDPITLEILWSRLIATADESAATLLRTSFSTIVRESNDYACVLMDANGDSLAENTGSIASFVRILSKTTKHLMGRFPPGILEPGDVLMTNDPWLATGHLPDITIAVPIFRGGRIVAWTANCAHSPDMGGSLWAADAREMFEEGLRIVPVKFLQAGKPNQTLIDIIKGNVRTPELTIGDMYAQVSAAEVCAQRLLELMDEQGIDDLGPLSHAIHTRAEQVMRRAIAEVQDGEYTYSIETDGYGGKPLKLCITITVRGDEIFVDYRGTSPQIDRGCNSVLNYTSAYTEYPIKCALTPHTPKNEGSNRPLHVSAPEGCVLNPRFPAAGSARQLAGHFLAGLVFGALAPAIPDKVIADSGGGPCLRTVYAGVGYHGQRFSAVLFASGGMGATPFKDGLSCVGFPANTGAGSYEALESVAPLIFWKAELLADSGGPGTYRGGLGQEVVVEVATEEPIVLSTMSDRWQHPAFGLFGGLHGSPSKVVLNDGQPVNPKGRMMLQPRDRLTLHFAGGGGYGPPVERDVELVERDLRDELISTRAAAEVYKLAARRRPRVLAAAR